MADQIKIFIINLARSEDRRKEITKKLVSHSIDFEIIEAVDGTLLTDEFMQKIEVKTGWYKADWGPQQSMKRGEAGVSLSHFKIYEKIIKEGISYAVILEDDADFNKDFERFIKNKNKIELLMKKFDLLLLGYCGHDVDYYKPGECSYWGRIKLDNLFKAGIPIKWYWSAIGYVITNRGATLLAAKQTSIPCVTADILTANSPQYGVKLGIIRKQIIWPSIMSNYSTIQVPQERKNTHSSQKLVEDCDTQHHENEIIRDRNFIRFFLDVYTSLKSNMYNIRTKLDRRFYQFKTDRY